MNFVVTKNGFPTYVVRAVLLAIMTVIMAVPDVMASIGCELNDAKRDVPRLYPQATGYETRYASFNSLGGERLLRKIEDRLDSRHTPVYAPLDVPYTIYEVFNGKKLIGYVHGVNQKGQFGGNQVFVSLDLNGTIKSFYIQKMSGRWASKFRDARFGKQFVGVTLKDFTSYDPVTGKGSGRLAEIHNPAPEAETDFLSIMRALKKNLILMEEFGFLPAHK